MQKQAFRSYLASLHPRNYKKITKRDKGAMYFVFLMVLSNLVSSGMNGNDNSLLILLVLFHASPALLYAWSGMSGTFLMPKAAFLTPMTYEDRKEYTKWVVIYEIGGAAILSILIECVLGVWFGFHVIQMAGTVLTTISLAIVSYINLNVLGKTDNKKVYGIVKDKTEMIHVVWLNYINMALGIFSYMGMGIIQIENNTEHWKYFLPVFWVLLLFGDIVIVKGQFDAVVALASNYELSFKIEGKIEYSDEKKEKLARQ